MPTVAENKKNTNSILSKIINIQSKVLGVKKTQQGHNYKYEDLNSIITMLHPYLAEQGVAISHTVITDENGQYVCRTTLFDKDSSYDVLCPIPDVSKILRNGNIMQGMGSAITYARRYNLKNIFNLFSTDDDAAILTIETITPAQQKQVSDLLSKIDDTTPFMEWLSGTFDVAGISELSKSQASQVITALKTKVAKNA